MDTGALRGHVSAGQEAVAVEPKIGTRRGTPRTLRLLVNGLGRVGRAFVELILERRDALESERGIRLELAGIATSRAVWVADGAATPAAEVLAWVGAGELLTEVPGVVHPADGVWAIASLAADVLVEAIPSDLRSGEPEATHIRDALARGWHVVTAAKGALVNYPELLQAAEARGRRLRFGAATAAALPTVDFARYCLAGARIVEVAGILNGTSNFILDEMRRAGRSYADALRSAQRLGIAEPDPAQDVDGWDTAAKLVLIANAVWGVRLRLGGFPVEGITGLGRRELEEAASTGAVIRLLGTLRWEGSALQAAVRPTPLPSDHLLAGVGGAEKAVMFVTDTMDRVAVSGGRSNPLGAAAALLRDVIHLAEAERAAPAPRAGVGRT